MSKYYLLSREQTVQQDEQTIRAVLRQPAADASMLYKQRSLALQGLLDIAAQALSEHAARQALNVSDYAYPSDVARALGAAAHMLRALGVRQDLIERVEAESRKQQLVT